MQQVTKHKVGDAAKLHKIKKFSSSRDNNHMKSQRAYLDTLEDTDWGLIYLSSAGDLEDPDAILAQTSVGNLPPRFRHNNNANIRKRIGELL